MENNKAVGSPTNEKSDTTQNKKIGVVSNCKNLRVRKTPDKNSEVIAYISAGTEVEIDKTENNLNFYKVRVSKDIEGYCMRNYINIR